jgi:hypothetical protein
VQRGVRLRGLTGVEQDVREDARRAEDVQGSAGRQARGDHLSCRGSCLLGSRRAMEVPGAGDGDLVVDPGRRRAVDQFLGSPDRLIRGVDLRAEEVQVGQLGEIAGEEPSVAAPLPDIYRSQLPFDSRLQRTVPLQCRQGGRRLAHDRVGSSRCVPDVLPAQALGDADGLLTRRAGQLRIGCDVAQPHESHRQHLVVAQLPSQPSRLVR